MDDSQRSANLEATVERKLSEGYKLVNRDGFTAVLEKGLGNTWHLGPLGFLIYSIFQQRDPKHRLLLEVYPNGSVVEEVTKLED